MAERTMVLSVHPFRRTARRKERKLQNLLDNERSNASLGLPTWVRGARVEKAGPMMYAVVGTDNRGH